MSRRLKVAYIITKSELGGAQTHLLDLCDSLKDQITPVVIAGGHGPLLQQLQARHITCHALDSLGNTFAPWRVVSTLNRLLRLLREEQPDLIHAHSAVAGAQARIAGRITGIPVIYTVHGFGFKKQIPLVRRLLVRLGERLLAPLTAEMICVSDTEVTLAHSLPIVATRISVIKNGLPDHAARAVPEAPTCGIVMTARFAPPKRQDLLIAAYAEANLGQKTTLTFAGNGPLLAESRARALREGLNKVRFAGDVSDVPQLLARHQIFVLLSDHEGLPISIIEAMRAGLPILASDLPGIRELVTHGEECLLVSNQDVWQIAQWLHLLCTSPSLRAKLGAAARRRYETEFGSARMANATHALYRRASDPTPTLGLAHG